MKKIIAILIILVLVMPISSVQAQAKDISVVIDGITQNFEASPVNLNGSVMVPMRAIFETLQAKINYDSNKREITAKKGSKIIVLTIDSTNVFINEKQYQISIAPQIIKDRTMVPLRFVSESLGAAVEWDPNNNAVIIDSTVKQSSSISEKNAEDEKLIRNIFDKKNEYENKRDGRGYHTLLYKPKETIEEMQQAFNNYRFNYEIESLTDIEINGEEATANFVQLSILYDNFNGEKLVSVVLKTEFKVYLAKINEQWLFVQFEKTKFEQLPTEYVSSRLISE